MQKDSRKYNSIKNSIYGIVSQTVIALLTFISRIVFIKILGMEYLGINGLFTSLLTVLSLAELGFGNIVVFSLYKPLAEQNYSKIAGLIAFYRKIYFIIAGVIAVLGVIVIPLLPVIVNVDQEIEHLLLYYLLFLGNTVVSYLFVYKSSLIRADQKQYIVSNYTMFFKIIMTIVQVLILVVWSNYILYLIVQLLCTFLTNYSLSIKSDKLYPFLKSNLSKIEGSEKNRIFKDVRAMFSYRVGGIILNSTDNMFISAMVNTLSVGVYSNYTLIIGFVNQFLNVLYDAIYSSVGNLNATSGLKRKKEVFDMLVLLFSWLGSFCFVCLFELSNPFLEAFLGKEVLFSSKMILVICINFYLPIILYPIWMYRNTTGLFQETKNVLLYTAGLNIVFSYVFGKYWGILGIISATLVSRILSSFWFEPYILYKKGFHENVSEYFITQIKYVICIAVSIGSIEFLTQFIVGSVLFVFFVKLMLCLLIPNIVVVLFVFKSNEFEKMKSMIWTKKHV